jgi:hypothetical protein
MESDVKFRVEQLPEGGYRATADKFPGLVAEGRTADGSIEAAGLFRIILKRCWRQRPTIKNIAGSYRLFFHSFDCNEPQHVHAQREDRLCKFWLQPLVLGRTTAFPPAN